MNPTLKRYLVSSTTTFVTFFLISITAQLQAGAISPDNVGWSVLGSIVGVAIRAAIKPAIEVITGFTGDPKVSP